MCTYLINPCTQKAICLKKKKMKREIKKSKGYRYLILVLKDMGKSFFPINHNQIFKRQMEMEIQIHMYVYTECM